MKVVVDSAKCTGHGRCYQLAPGLFDEDEQGHSVVCNPDVAPDLESKARLAQANCPEDAISIDES